MGRYINRMLIVLVVILSLLMTACSGESTSPARPESVSPAETSPSPTTIPEPTNGEPGKTPPETTIPPSPPPNVIAEDFEETLKNHFGFMPAFLDFTGALEAGGIVKALCVSGGANLTRKEIDAYTAYAAEYGAKGLAWCKLESGSGLQPTT